MTKIRIIDEFTDDHLPCVTFTYRGREYSLWWTTHETIGAILYPDSPKAQRHLAFLLRVLDRMTDDIYRELQEGEREFPKLGKYGHFQAGNQN